MSKAIKTFAAIATLAAIAWGATHIPAVEAAYRKLLDDGSYTVTGQGYIPIGGASGVLTSLDANDSGKIIVGDGTTAVSVAVSGDATLSSAGALTLAADSVESSMIAAGAVGTTDIASNAITTGLIAAGAVGTTDVADDAITGLKAAPSSAAGGVPIVFAFTIASGANANTDIAVATGTDGEVTDLVCALNGAGTAGGTLSLTDTSATIVTAIDVSAGGDNDVFRAAEIDNAASVFTGGATTLRVVSASSGADFPGARCWVYAVRQ